MLLDGFLSTPPLLHYHVNVVRDETIHGDFALRPGFTNGRVYTSLDFALFEQILPFRRVETELSRVRDFLLF